MSAGKVLAQTIAGGVTINDTLWHFAHKNLPFGGVGASGIGAYHGEASFLAFTHRKPVFVQPRFAASKLLYPPYGATFDKVLAMIGLAFSRSSPMSYSVSIGSMKNV